MSNAQDLLSILGGAQARSAGGSRAATTSGSTETSILSFKAGKMNTTLKPNGKYLVEPDSRRGELHVVWTTAPSGGAGAAGGAGGAGGGGAGGGSGGGGAGGHLKLEWKDRRTRTTVNAIPVFPEDDATFERVETGREGDRVYLLQCGSSADSRHFFWMQDKDSEPDEDLCVKVNLYITDNSEAASAAGASAAASADGATGATGAAAASNNGMDNAELLRIMQGALGSQGLHDAEGARTTTVPGSNSIPTANAGQVDALGNILENLGMPQPNGTPAGEQGTGHGTAAGGGGGGAAAASGAAGGTGGLTLADLQGAMAGLATASPPAAAAASAGPPLSEMATSEIIDSSGILSDPAAVERLVALLPEGQRTEDKLRENIRSPQVAQCLQRLTSALADDAGSFNSIIANFQLDPADGMSAMASGNPIEAFLNCLLKDVERKEGIKKPTTEEEGKDGEGGGEGGGGSGESKEDGDGGGKEGGGDGDVKMDES